jgi:hypothetical protein
VNKGALKAVRVVVFVFCVYVFVTSLRYYFLHQDTGYGPPQSGLFGLRALALSALGMVVLGTAIFRSRPSRVSNNLRDASVAARSNQNIRTVFLSAWRRKPALTIAVILFPIVMIALLLYLLP